MKLYIVTVSAEVYDIVYGVATTPEKAIDIAHKVQERGEDKPGHIIVSAVESDEFIPEGA